MLYACPVVRKLPIANPTNRFAATEVVWDEAPPEVSLHVYEERGRRQSVTPGARAAPRSIVTEVKSPDVGMRWSVNPYRGCFHACAYCYARPSHQYLGFGAGTDFDRHLVVKVDAPELLRETFERKSWKGESITFSGNTDCYQPLEGKYRLTRRLLEICADYRNPAHVITKSALIRRDVDVLVRLSREAHVGVTLSIPFADDEMGRAIEPYASAPSVRMETVRILSEAGIETSVNIAPVIPGLNDSDVGVLVERAAEAGAKSAAILPVRLAMEVLPVFFERLEAAYPNRVEKVKHAILEARGGKLNEANFGDRMRAGGPRWEATRQLFEAHCRKFGLGTWEPDDYDGAPLRPAKPETFRRPRAQQELF
jgi:DNA repair photolyase